jgi:ribose transport system permease protein
VVGFGIGEPGTFFTTGNFNSIAITQATTLFLAVAVSFPLRAGDFDLSVAGLMVLCSAVVVRLAHAGVPILLAVVLTLLVGVVVGLVNALAVVRLELNSFVTTLATMTVLEGLGFLLTKGTTLVNVPSSLTTFADFRMGPFPLSVYYSWFFVALAWYLFQATPYGRYLIVVGGDRTAASRLGIPVRRVRISAFIFCSVAAAFSGVVLAGFLGSVDASQSAAYLLPPYAAAFLGSTTIRVGEFNALGTMIAVYFIAIGVTGLEILGLSSWVADVFAGGALLIGLLSAHLISRAERRRLVVT